MQKKFYLYKRGKKYYCQIRDPKTGEIGSQRSTGQTNKTRAEAWAAAECERLEQAAGSSTMLFSEWAGRFWADKCPHVSRLKIEGRPVAKSTIKQNRAFVEKYIMLDQICEKQLGEVSRADIMDFRDRLVKAKGQSRSAQMVYGALRIILNEALERGLIQSSPTAGLHKIAYTKQVRSAVPIPDIQRLLLVQHWDDLNAWRAVMTAAMTGMRAGEVRGLQWADLDSAGHKIYIRHNIPAHETEVKAPKWGKSRVTVYPEKLREILEPLRAEKGHVFAVKGEPIGYDAMTDALEIAWGRAGVRITLHQLRHSLNTYLRGAGMPDDLLRGSFGWSSAAVQDGYTHRQLYDLTPIENALQGIL